MRYLHILVFITLSCEARREFYNAKGTIQDIDANIYQVIIAHDTIPNLMMPMTMPFFVPDLQELEKLSEDSVILVWDEAEILKLLVKVWFQVMMIFLMMNFLKKDRDCY